MPTFPKFYRVVNRLIPFPWQARLAELVAQDEVKDDTSDDDEADD